MTDGFRGWSLPPETFRGFQCAVGSVVAPTSLRISTGVEGLIKPYLGSMTGYSAFATAQSASIVSALAPIQASITAFVAQVMPSALDGLRGAVPANLRMSSTKWDIDAFNRLMVDEGLPIAWVPRASILDRVFAAPRPAARRAIYGRSWKQIVDDCDELMARADSVEMEQYVYFIGKAIEGLRAGHHELAQAMIMNTFDTVLKHRLPPKMRSELTNTKKPLDTDELSFRVYFAACSIWSIHHRYFPEKGDPIPRTLNRHATVHGVSRRQYTRVNAVIALAHLTGLIWFLDSSFSRGRRA